MEWTILTSVLILVVLLVIQYALVYHARHVALASAQEGARVARSQPEGDGWRQASIDKATSSVTKFGPRLLTKLSVTAGEAADGVADQRFVQVSGHAPTIIPFMDITVTQRSQGPVECFRPDTGGTECQ